MSKIETIKLKNFKAIAEEELNLKGCTVIVTAGNDKGKTSLLKGMIDRIRFIRPDVTVKSGEESGNGELTLTTGEKFTWEFDINGKDVLKYVTEKGIKTSVTKDLGKTYFPNQFDIDKFLQSSPKEQGAQLQKIIGIDFTEIDARYKKAYDNRTEKNKDAERYRVKLTAMLKAPKVNPVDLTLLSQKKEAEEKRMQEIYLANKTKNDELRAAWNEAKEKINADVTAFNDIQKSLTTKKEKATAILEDLVFLGYAGKEVSEWINTIIVEPLKISSDLYPKEPEYITEQADDKVLKEIDAEILAASETNTKANEYKAYIDQKELSDKGKVEAKEADDEVKAIEAERQKMIEGANFPKGVSLTSEGVTVDGFPLDKNQISTSKIYCTALRIAAMGLGEVKALYFDASFLDKNTLMEIEKWADEMGLQLLIERPDWNDGEITYQLIEENGNESK